MTLKAQPEPRNNCTPACYQPNPPWWCDCSPVPLDSGLPILLIAGILLAIFAINKNKVKVKAYFKK